MKLQELESCKGRLVQYNGKTNFKKGNIFKVISVGTNCIIDGNTGEIQNDMGVLEYAYDGEDSMTCVLSNNDDFELIKS